MLDQEPGHGERLRLQLLFRLAGIDTAAVTFWLYAFGCPVLAVPVHLIMFKFSKSALDSEAARKNILQGRTTF